jgi:hypothetical protein
MTRPASSTCDSTCGSYLNCLVAIGADNPIAITLAPLTDFPIHTISYLVTDQLNPWAR